MWGVEFQPGLSHLTLARELRLGQFEVNAWGNNPPEIIGRGIYMEHSRGGKLHPGSSDDLRPSAGVLIGATNQSLNIVALLDHSANPIDPS